MEVTSLAVTFLQPSSGLGGQPCSDGEKLEMQNKTKQNKPRCQKKKKKSTFLPLYFRFPQHFIYTHDVVLEKQKGNQKGNADLQS